ncbi:hypothetical protein EBR96_06285 [bacterium]|nr:hypothetical protein [bacterium]
MLSNFEQATVDSKFSQATLDAAFSKEPWGSVSPDLRDFIKQMLDPNPANRPTAEQVAIRFSQT